MTFAVPSSVYRKWRETGEGWCCPNGHPRVFAKNTEVDRLQQQLAEKARRIEYLEADRDAARKQADHHRRSAAVVKGKHRAMKTRVAAGICPCCRRPFANLMRHMHNQHPTFASAKDD